MDQEPGQLRPSSWLEMNGCSLPGVSLDHQALATAFPGCLVGALPIAGNEGRKKGPKVGRGQGKNQPFPLPSPCPLQFSRDDSKEAH